MADSDEDISSGSILRDLIFNQYQAIVLGGTALAGRTMFRTLSRAGTYEFEAISVSSKKIPASAWAIPQGYERYVR